MHDARFRPPEEGDKGGDRRPWGSLAGLALILVLVILGYVLTQKLKAMSELQDCVMSGRTNCAPITPDK